jgi:DNA modification methylase
VRYDLSPSSYEYSEIDKFNRNLKKIATLYNYVSLSETSVKRERFIKHVLHWNSLGKTLVLKLILLQINKLVRKEFQTLFNLAWKDNDLVGNMCSGNEEITVLFDNVNVHANSEIKKKLKIELQETGIDEINVCKTSVRQRKAAVTRRENLLW